MSGLKKKNVLLEIILQYLEIYFNFTPLGP